VALDGMAEPNVTLGGIAGPGVALGGVVEPDVALDGVVEPDVTLGGMVGPGVALGGVVEPNVTLGGMVGPGVALGGVASPGVALGGVFSPSAALDWSGVAGRGVVDRDGGFLATGLENLPLSVPFSKTLPPSVRGLGGRDPALGLASLSANESRASSSLRICLTLGAGVS
jgi:hypothetical protein